MKKNILLVLLSLSLVACGGGPPEDALQSEVQGRLNDNFEQGLLEVVNFQRRGSQPYTSKLDGSSGVLVYFKAQLRFLKDYKLSNWDSLNVGSLMSVLGAGPAGVSGVNPKGNQAGDELEVFGLQAFLEEDGDWVAANFTSKATDTRDRGKESAYVSEIDAVEEKYFGMGAPWYKDYIQGLQKVARGLRKSKNRQAEASLRAELTLALTTAQLEEASTSQQISFLSGNPEGDYFAVGSGLESVTRPESLQNLVAFPSGGSIDNLNLIKNDLATFAIAQSDVAAMSYRGEAVFKGSQNSRLRAVGALFPEAVQIIVRRDAGITSISQLAGKRVNIGSPGTGGHANAEQVFRAHGIDPAGFYGHTMDTAAKNLQEGKLDAILITSAYPSRVIQHINADIDILTLDKEALGNLVDGHGLIPITIPAKTYAGVDHPVMTVGVTALLVTNLDTDGDKVREIMETVYANVEQLSRVNPQAGLIDPEQARRGLSIPLHPAAEKYFAEK